MPASGAFCRLLMIFTNSLDPDQARHIDGPNPDICCFMFDNLILFPKECLEISNVKNYLQTPKKKS